MGQTISWTCWRPQDETPSLRSARGKREMVINRPSTNIVPSKPKAITIQGPYYTPGSLKEKYEMLEEIGEGSTSVVYKCKSIKAGTVHACKIINHRQLVKRRGSHSDQFKVEIQVLQALHHPNIIRMDDVFTSDSKICMVTEFIGGGELFDYIVEKGTLSELEASGFVRKIMSAVAYMHSCGIVHRDLKPENLMLTSKTANAEVKLIDFGLAKLLDGDDKTASFLGTRGYLAPELLQRKSYTMTVDMWAVGVIVYILLCGCLPFNDDGSKVMSDNAVRAKYTTLRFPHWAQGLSDSAKELLQHLLDVDSSTRYTAEQALAHPWVTGHQTPNKYLRSPDYLRRVKQNRLNNGSNGNHNGSNNGNASRSKLINGLSPQATNPVRSRRQSR